jgi:hypothetical protein
MYNHHTYIYIHTTTHTHAHHHTTHNNAISNFCKYAHDINNKPNCTTTDKHQLVGEGYL